VRNGNWDYHGLGIDGRITGDPYVALSEIVEYMLPPGYGTYGFDVAPYFVEVQYEYPRFVCYDCHAYTAYPVWDPYRDWCGTFKLVIYDEPAWYPTTVYPATHVVPAGGGVVHPQFVIKGRTATEPPVVRVPGTRTRGTRAEPGVRGRDLGGIGTVKAPRERKSGGVGGLIRRLFGDDGGARRPEPREVAPPRREATPPKLERRKKGDSQPGARAPTIGQQNGTRRKPAVRSGSQPRSAPRATSGRPPSKKPVQPKGIGDRPLRAGASIGRTPPATGHTRGSTHYLPPTVLHHYLRGGPEVPARHLILTAALCTPAVLGAQSGASIQQAAASITAGDVARRVGLLADDSMRGRTTPSPELDLTAQYIAGEFQRLGLTPGGDDDTYLQRYPLEMRGVDTVNPVLTIAGGPEFHLGRNAARFMGLSGGAGRAIEGPVTLVWGSVTKPTDVAEFDLAGSIALYLPEIVNGQLTRASWITLSGIRSRAGALIVLGTAPEEAWARTLAGESASQPSPEGSTPRARMAGGAPMLEIPAESLAETLADHGIDLAAVVREKNGPAKISPVHGMSASVTLQNVELPSTSAPNVVAVLEGSDPELKDEFVVFSAHMYHAGTTSGAPFCRSSTEHPDDEICNGADDNASGTVAVIELAEAFAALEPRPKRSIVFLTVSGEERGLWGSEYYAKHPTVPMDQIVANVNVDMVGRNWPDTIVAIGKEHSDLGETLDRVSAEHPELNMTAIDDIWPEENFYNRSDHIHFARAGVPILFFFNGTHDDYHAVTDHPDKIDAEKESRIVKLLLYLGIDIANAAERPKWNPESYEKVVS
jgi:hypothetical protein